jgi:hypothetical protein
VTARHTARSRLIAVDGTRELHLAAAAKRIVRMLRDNEGEAGVSAWDSSGIFTELAMADPDVPGPSARTLTLLYAADLAFRLRWQINPALEAGQSVVAAPYVESAIALGIGAGLPKRWLVELFRFAPKPHACYRISERGGRGKAGAAGGYPELFRDAIEASGDAIDPVRLRKQSIEYLDRLQRRHRCEPLNERAIAALSRPHTRRT